MGCPSQSEKLRKTRIFEDKRSLLREVITLNTKLKTIFFSVIIYVLALAGVISPANPAYADWSNFINGDPEYVYFSITEMTPRGPIIIPAGITASGCWQEEWLGGLVSDTNELDELLQCAIVYSEDSIPFTIESLFPSAEYNNDDYGIDYYYAWVLQNPDNKYTQGVSNVSKEYDITDTDSYGYVVIYAPDTNQIMQGISYYWYTHV